MRSILLFASGIAAAGLHLLPSTVHAQAIFTEGHGDLGIAYTSGSAFAVTWGIDPGALVDGVPLSGTSKTHYAPGDLIVNALTTMTLSSTPIANALGISTGSTVYRIGNNNYQPNLGFAANGVGDETQWDDGYISISLDAVTGPGELALFHSGSGGVIFSSRGDSYTANDNQWEIFAGDHVHPAWYFSSEGYYEITFTWAGTYIGGDSPVAVSSTETFGVYVGAMPIPEPSTWALAAAGLSGLFIHRRRLRLKEKSAN